MKWYLPMINNKTSFSLISLKCQKKREENKKKIIANPINLPDQHQVKNHR